MTDTANDQSSPVSPLAQFRATIAAMENLTTVFQENVKKEVDLAKNSYGMLKDFLDGTILRARTHVLELENVAKAHAEAVVSHHAFITDLEHFAKALEAHFTGQAQSLGVLTGEPVPTGPKPDIGPGLKEGGQ